MHDPLLTLDDKLPVAKGRNLGLSVPRRLVCDLLHFARKVPTVPVQRLVDLGELPAVRARMARRPGWCPIFTKAYAIVASRFPELRRSYLPFPYPHLYEHPGSVASIALEREYKGEPAVLFVRLRQPERQGLFALEAHLKRYKDTPLEKIAAFRRAIKVSRLPRPIRRLIWWIGLSTSGRRRVKHFGTFGVSVYSGLGAESLHPLSPLSTTLNYGVIGEDGRVPVRVVYDHRVMDGSTVARALGCLEQVLAGEIADELRAEAVKQAA